MNKESSKVYLVVHIIWTVKGRESLLQKPIRNILFAHLKAISGEKFIKLMAVNGTEEHIHCLLQLHPMQTLSQVVQNIKNASALWINENKIIQKDFEWEDGYAAYSVSPSAVKQVVDFIERQEEYHNTKTLENELAIFEKVDA